jgi:hypothetical protein
MLTQSTPEASRSRIECRQSSRSSSPSSCDAPIADTAPLPSAQPLPQTLVSPCPDNYACLVTLLQVLADKEPNAVQPQLSTATMAESTTGQEAHRQEWRRSQSVPWDTRSSVVHGGMEPVDLNISNDSSNDRGSCADVACDVDLLKSPIRSQLMRSKSWEGRSSRPPPLTAGDKAGEWASVRWSQGGTSPRKQAAEQQDQGKQRPRSKLVLSESRNSSWAPEARLPDEAEREEKQRAHRPTVSDMGGYEGDKVSPVERQRAMDAVQSQQVRQALVTVGWLDAIKLISPSTATHTKELMMEMQREIKSRWTIHYSELELLGKIGMGDFGIVYLAKWRNSKGAWHVTSTVHHHTLGGWRGA